MGEVVIEKLLGWGSCGSVYLGRQASGRLVAVKQSLRDGTPRSERLLQRLHLEAHVMSSLSHKLICQCFGLAKTQDSYFLIMEFAAGGDLLDYINEKGGLSERTAQRLFRQLLQAVQFLHQSGYVHRVCACFTTTQL
jgi:serine/threonine protein kinase